MKTFFGQKLEQKINYLCHFGRKNICKLKLFVTNIF